jgi:hypothetical protein
MFLETEIHETLVFYVFSTEKNKKNNYRALKLKKMTFILLIRVTDGGFSCFWPWSSKIHMFFRTEIHETLVYNLFSAEKNKKNNFQTPIVIFFEKCKNFNHVVLLLYLCLIHFYEKLCMSGF